jgi:TolB-like protein
MKAVRLFAALLGVAMLAGGAAAEDNYDRLARELTEAGSSLENKKIAIIPFAHADGRAVSKDGSVVSERLTIKMINTRKFEIIERSVLDKVMDELKLQSTGAIDATSAKELGKVLGVEAIITGTLVETSSGKIEVNARLIKTETAQAIGASQVTVEKDWIGDTPTQMPAQQQAQQPQVYQPQQAAKPAAPRERHPNEYGYFDIFLGGGSRNIDITYENTGTGVYMTHIGFTPVLIPDGPYREIKLEALEGSGIGPIGMRVGGFGKGAIGGAFEFSANSHIVEPQTVSGTRNGTTTTFTLPSGGNYLEMTSFGFVGNLFIRHAGKVVDPYFGIGLGLSLNRVYMPYVKGYTSSSTFARPVDQMGVGLIFNMPIGVRIKLDPKTHIVAELRYELNSVSFDRDIRSESDSISSDGVRFLVGMGFGF